MGTIDDKVVAMSFESSKFESGVNNTISALDKLKASLKFPDAGKSLNDFGAAAKRLDLSHIGRGVDAITQKLGYFSVAALAIFSNVAMKAASAGAQIVKSLSIEPLIAGYKEYATNLNSIQTILANTEASGATLKDVNAALDELNRYSDKTIYNFSQMARNIGTFTAAGVELKVATGSIKGIANLAALSGSSAEQASTAMYQLSQAISAGSVKLMDWNSVVNAGMGGTVFQRALAQTAEAMGTLKKGTVELTGPMKNVTIAGKSFRNSLAADGKDSWLTSDVLTKTLKQFTGDLKDAELAAMGFNAQQIKAIQQTAKTATFAATEVKTITQVMDVAKETAGSGWAQTWRIIFGDFVEAKTTFTALSNAINGFINKNAEARNKVLQDWKDLGGRTALIDSISTAFRNIGMILKPIKEAFREIFPAKTGADLMYLTQQFEAFVAKLKPSRETIAMLKATFLGLFSVLDIGWEIVKGIIGVFGDLVGATGAGSGGFLQFTARIGLALTEFHAWLIEGGKLAAFFNNLGNILAAPVKLLSKFAGAIADLFSGFSPGGISGELDGIGRALTPLEAIVEGISTAWEKFVQGVDDAIDAQSILMGISEAIQGIGSAIGHAASTMNFEAILSVIRTGLFASLVLMFKKFLGRGSFLEQLNKGFGKGILSNISGAFDGLNGSMKAMQQNLKAKTLKEIAIAIALLAAALLMISLIDPKRLKSSLGAMTILFGELIGAMALLDKIAKTGGFLKLPIIIAGLIGLAIAIDLLTLAVLAMSRLSWDELLRGLAGVGALLAGISAAAKPLSANSGGLIRAGASIILLAIGLRILANAVAAFGALSWEELSKGLLAVGVGLGVIAAASRVMPTGMIAMGVGLIAVATGLRILAEAVIKFSTLDWKAMIKGLAGIGGSLLVIAGAMQLMPKSMVLTAAGLAIVALSLNKIADAVVKMGGLSIKQIAKGLVTLAGSLAILAAALHLMSGTLGGAAALSLAAVGIGLLASALVLLGKQSWTSIVKGMVALAGALTIMGIAGVALAPVAPALLALGAAMLLIGAGLALAGAGLFLIAGGISALAIAGPTGIAIIHASLIELYKTIPELAKNLVIGLLAIVDGLAKAAPQFVNAIVKIIGSLLDAIIKSAPKMAVAFIALLDAGLVVLRERQGEIIQAGIDLLIALLQGIKDNIAQVTAMVVDIVVTFLRTLSTNLGRIVTAGVQLLVSFLKGIANNLGRVVTAAYDIVIKFISSITSNLGRVLTAGVSIMVKLVAGITNNIGKIIKAGTDAVISFVTAIGEAGVRIVRAGVAAAGKFVTAIATEIPKLAQQVFDALILLINGMADVIGSEQNMAKLRTAAKNLGFAIINGMTLGLAGKAQDLYNKATEIMDKTLGIFKKIPFINSPSKVTAEIGAGLVEGLVLGLDKTAVDAYSSATALSNGVINAFNTAFQTASPSKVMMEIGAFVGQGFAQGLRGSKDDINSAFAELNEKLTKAITTARETIISEQEKLDKLRASKKPDTAAIKKAQEIIDQNEELIKKSIATRYALNNSLKDEHRRLTALTVEYQNMGEKIKAAGEELKRIQDFVQTIKSQYSDTPDISGPMTEEITAARKSIAEAQAELNEAQSKDSTAEQIAAAQENLRRAQEAFNSLVQGKVLDDTGNSVNILATYLLSLKNQSDAVEAYNATLEQLRKLGLDETTYRKLLEEGTANQSFANQLLAGGKTAVTALNKLDKQLLTVSGKLATNAAENLEHGGVAAAQGLLKGLTSKNKAIKDAMDNLVEEIITTIKRKMHIKSPSKVFEEIGAYAMQGLAIGFSKSTKVVTDAVKDAASDAMTAMRSSMRKITDMVTNELNPSPVITPILDLTQVQRQSGALAALTNVTPITAAASYGQASIISSEQNAIQTDELAALSGGTSVKFEQNNYSPESLSEIEIYRQTRNQLSQFKSILATT